jgi:RNA polymerase sigma-32 factor
MIVAVRENRTTRKKLVDEPRTDEPSVARPKDANFAVFTQEMRQHAILNREEELELFTKWKATGDRRIADRLIAANLRLTLLIAKQYDRRRHDILDLIQEGSIGLFHALTKFEPERGIRFTSYASYWIRAYMLKFILANHHLVKLGTTQEQRKLFFNLTKTRALLEKDGTAATVEQIAEKLEVDAKDVIEVEMRMGAAVMPLDAPLLADIADGAAPRHYEFPADEKWRPDVTAEENDFRYVAEKHVAAFGRTLDEREHAIFARRLIAEDPVKLAVLADEMGITRERVRQIEVRIKDRLRQYLRRKMRTQDLIT